MYSTSRRKQRIFHRIWLSDVENRTSSRLTSATENKRVFQTFWSSSSEDKNESKTRNVGISLRLLFSVNFSFSRPLILSFFAYIILGQWDGCLGLLRLSDELRSKFPALYMIIELEDGTEISSSSWDDECGIMEAYGVQLRGAVNLWGDENNSLPNDECVETRKRDCFSIFNVSDFFEFKFYCVTIHIHHWQCLEKRLVTVVSQMLY